MLLWLHYQLEVKDFIGRDVKLGTIGTMATQLETWCNNCGEMMKTMECEMSRANKVKEQRLADHRRLEEEVRMCIHMKQLGYSVYAGVILESNFGSSHIISALKQ